MTRQEYMNAKTDTAHREYYAQFVTPRMIDKVGIELGAKLLQSKDQYFDNIPLHTWSELGSYHIYEMSFKLKEKGDFLSLVGVVCILKEAARQWLETQTNKG